MQRSFTVGRFIASALLVGAVGCAGLEDEVGSVGQAAKGKGGQAQAPTLADQLAARGVTAGARCGVEDPSATESAAIDAQLANFGLDDGSVVNIAVHWHVITTATGGGDVSALIPAQMQVLNTAYAPSRFAFHTASVEVVANNVWFFSESGSPEEVAMKSALRRGDDPRSLNIYTNNGDVFLGWATPPFYYNFFPDYDGVVLWWAALPGTGLSGPAAEEPDGVLTYDQGDTGTHEVGHWLGLDHTFGPGNGCTTPGDKVKDTPVEAYPQFFCAERDTCVGPGFPGKDPITNYMDYVDDPCMTHFTSEQTKRMRKQWHAFRDKAQ